MRRKTLRRQARYINKKLYRGSELRRRMRALRKMWYGGRRR